MVSFVAVLRLVGSYGSDILGIELATIHSGYFWQLLKLGNAKVVYQPHEAKSASNWVKELLSFEHGVWQKLQKLFGLVNNKVQPQYPSSIIFLLLQKESELTPDLHSKATQKQMDWT
ncbi:unnamed protein product [Prunus brigantina]